MKTFLRGRSPSEFAWLRFILLRCCPGDWRDRDHIYFIASPDVTKQDVLRLLFRVLVPPLFGHCPHRYPDHRWSGYDVTLKDMGLPGSIHNWGAEAYSDMMHTYFSDEVTQQRPPPGDHDLAAIADGREESDTEGEDSDRREAVAPQQNASAAVPSGNPHVASPEDVKKSWQRILPRARGGCRPSRLPTPLPSELDDFPSWATWMTLGNFSKMGLTSRGGIVQRFSNGIREGKIYFFVWGVFLASDPLNFPGG